jgi:hypothetical protein
MRPFVAAFLAAQGFELTDATDAKALAVEKP